MKKNWLLSRGPTISSIFNTNHNNTVVNKKGETAKLAIERDLTELRENQKQNR